LSKLIARNQLETPKVNFAILQAIKSDPSGDGVKDRCDKWPMKRVESHAQAHAEKRGKKGLPKSIKAIKKNYTISRARSRNFFSSSQSLQLISRLAIFI
jgi:hypothetical protein